MNTLLKKMLLTVIAGSLLLFLSGCSLFNKKPEGIIPMEEIIAQDKSPIEIISASVKTTAGAKPAITITMKNISDKSIKIITWAVININKDGKLCSAQTEEFQTSYIFAIKSGETFVCEVFSSDPKTSQVKIVMKDVTYEFNMLWENSHYSSDIDTIISELNMQDQSRITES